MRTDSTLWFHPNGQGAKKKCFLNSLVKEYLMFPYKEIANFAIRDKENRYYTPYLLVLTRWQDIAQGWFKVGSPSTYVKVKYCSITGTNTILVLILHQTLSLVQWGRCCCRVGILGNQASLIYFLCSIQRQKHNWELKCSLSIQWQILHFISSQCPA